MMSAGFIPAMRLASNIVLGLFSMNFSWLSFFRPCNFAKSIQAGISLFSNFFIFSMSNTCLSMYP